jgi:hypothetical protein
VIANLHRRLLDDYRRAFRVGDLIKVGERSAT